jgi:hypothetical protein
MISGKTPLSTASTKSTKVRGRDDDGGSRPSHRLRRRRPAAEMIRRRRPGRAALDARPVCKMKCCDLGHVGRLQPVRMFKLRGSGSLRLQAPQAPGRLQPGVPGATIDQQERRGRLRPPVFLFIERALRGAPGGGASQTCVGS